MDYFNPPEELSSTFFSTKFSISPIFIEISEAYQVLSDPEKRRLYDQNKDIDIDPNFTFDEEVFSKHFVKGSEFGDFFSDTFIFRGNITAGIIFISFMVIEACTDMFNDRLLGIAFWCLLLILFSEKIASLDKYPGCIYALVGWMGLMLPLIVLICEKLSLFG